MIPELETLPQKQRALFDNTYHESLARGNSEAVAMRVAFEVVRGDAVAVVSATSDAPRYVFFTKDARAGEQLVSRTKEGNLVHTYVLSDIFPDGFGTAPSQELLEKWAAQLNKGRPSIDSDHELWNQVTRVHSDDLDMIARAMEAKSGLAKIIGAVVDAGKLIVRVMFDKRYENYVSRIKGLSIEAACKPSDDGTWTDGRIFGATFAMNSDPVNPRAVRLEA
jgi:hypothetical protein